MATQVKCKTNTTIKMYLISIFILCSIHNISCGEQFQKQDEENTVQQPPAPETLVPDDEKPATETPAVTPDTPVVTDKVSTDGDTLSLVGCEMPGSLLKVETIGELSRLINSLPKPVSIPCLLTALPRPLKLSGTKSRLSVQPAFDADNPRIFVFLKDLILAVSPKGELSEAVELSQLYNNQYSVKGEINFPVTAPIAEDYALTSVQRTDEAGKIVGTRCAGCHMEETVSTTFPAGFLSKALRPFDYQTTTTEKLTTIIENCKDNNEYRCIFFRSLTGPDGFLDAKFPKEMPTLF